MDSITLKCPAKINLSLDILGKRDDGYHEISTIMQTISLEDEVKIKKSNEFSVTSNREDIPLDDDNITLKAARLMFKEFKIQGGISIHINKNIPVAAGLAGGSTDAAGIILGINKLFLLNASLEKMISIAENIGSDVPYFLEKGTALCTGRGEVITQLNSLKDYYVLIAKPSIGISTKWVYDNLDLNKVEKRPNMDIILNAVKNNDIETISKNLVNVLETVTVHNYKIIDDIKKTMMEYGALGSIMSGSGSTVFGIFKDDSIENCYNHIKKEINEVYITKMI